MDDYGVNPVLSGLVQAFSMANVMKHQRMQQEQLQLQKNKDARQEEHEKFSEKRQGLGDQMAALNSGAKPLDPQGQYSEESSVPSAVPGMPATPVHLGGIPADPGRTANINGQNYQLPTRAEQDNRAFEQATRVGEANATAHSRGQIAADMAKIKAQHEEDQVQLPGQPGPVSRHAIPYLTEVERNKGQNDRDANDRRSKEKIAGDTNASRERAAGIRANSEGATARGLTANGQNTRDLADRREADADTATVQDSQTAEQQLWGQISQIQSQLDRKKILGTVGLDKDKELPMNPLKEAQFRSQLVSKRKEIDVLQKTQKQLVEKHGGKYDNSAVQAASAPAAAAPLVNPYLSK